MCLDLIKGAKRCTAEEDIIVYKRLRKGFAPSQFNHGDSFSGIIDGYECEGKISINGADVYFCTDEPKLDGLVTSDRLGYKYSWKLDNYVQEITVNGKPVNNVLRTPYYYAIIEIGNTYLSPLKRYRREVHEGLHSYKEPRRKNLYKYGSIHEITVECVIPKGAKYYVGMFSDDKAYASDTLKYVKILK